MQGVKFMVVISGSVPGVCWAGNTHAPLEHPWTALNSDLELLPCILPWPEEVLSQWAGLALCETRHEALGQ